MQAEGGGGGAISNWAGMSTEDSLCRNRVIVCVEFHRSFLFMRWPERSCWGWAAKCGVRNSQVEIERLFFFFLGLAGWGKGGKLAVFCDVWCND
jgi:hypothetical protein